MTGCVGCVKRLVIGMILQGQFQLKILSTSCWTVGCFTLSGTISPSSSSLPPQPGQFKDVHVKFILNHSDHVQVVRCISALKKRRESCLQLLDDGREGEIMPEGHLPLITTYGGLWDINQSIKTQDQQCQWPNKPRPQTQGS